MCSKDAQADWAHTDACVAVGRAILAGSKLKESAARVQSRAVWLPQPVPSGPIVSLCKAAGCEGPSSLGN